MADEEEEEEEEELPPFTMATSGRCPDGYAAIESRSACNEAAAELELSDTRAGKTRREDRPYGCYFRPRSRAGRKLWFAPNGNEESRSRTRFAVCAREE